MHATLTIAAHGTTVGARNDKALPSAGADIFHPLILPFSRPNDPPKEKGTMKRKTEDPGSA
jgi:hypothetical protein